MIIITYLIVMIISGLFWYWFGGNLNFFGEQGTHYDIDDFYSGCLGSFVLICPFVTSIVLLITKHWKVAISLICIGLLIIVTIFGILPYFNINN